MRGFGVAALTLSVFAPKPTYADETVPTNDDIVIGVVCPMTGGLAVYGEQMRRCWRRPIVFAAQPGHASTDGVMDRQ